MLEMKNLPACPVETTLQLIGDKWKVLIIRELFLGTRRFSELKSSLEAITQKMLTQQLRDLENSGLIIRKVYPVVPPKVEYSLSQLGLTLEPVLEALKAWGSKFKESYN